MMKTTLLAAASLSALTLTACQPADRGAAEPAPAATDMTAETTAMAPAQEATPRTPSSSTASPSSSNGSADGMNPDGAVNPNSPPPIVAPDPSTPPPT